jgi:hypothetical protein
MLILLKLSWTYYFSFISECITKLDFMRALLITSQIASIIIIRISDPELIINLTL